MAVALKATGLLEVTVLNALGRAEVPFDAGFFEPDLRDFCAIGKKSFSVSLSSTQ
jgi:hypothetical protein